MLSSEDARFIDVVEKVRLAAGWCILSCQSTVRCTDRKYTGIECTSAIITHATVESVVFVYLDLDLRE